MILLKNRDRNPSFKKGEYVEINDAGNYPMELSVDGVCEQTTTTGKNLYNVFDEIKSKTTYTTVDNDGWITMKYDNTNGTKIIYPYYSTHNLDLNVNTQYALMVEIKELSGNFAAEFATTHAASQNATNIFISSDYLSVGTKKYLITTKNSFEGTSEGLRTVIGVNAGDTGKIVFRMSVLADTAVTTDNFVYEPYTGGQPSPSPDFPQNISVLTGNLKLTSCGKNLFDINSLNFENVWIRPTGEKVAANNNGFLSYVEILPNAEYILSLNRIVSSIGICEYDKDKNFIQRIVVSNSSSKTIITSTTTKFIGVFINIDGTTLVTKDIIYECEPQLEKSNQATPYEPYQSTSLNITIPENEFIGKINDTYKDTLKVEYNEEDGQYHLVLNKMIGKVVLDGSETITINNTGTANWYYTIKKTMNNYVGGVGLSNYYKYANISNSNTVEGFAMVVSPKSIRIRYGTEDTPTNYKNWLSTHNTEVYYPLATPYEVDLGIVDTLLSYNEVTNVFTDSDLYPVINAKYYKDFEFDKILRSGYNIDEQEYEIAKKQMANGKRKRILSSYDDCIIKINLGLLDNKTYQEYKEQLNDGEFHYWSYKYNQYKKANFILTKPSITTEYAYDDDIGIDDIEITLEKSSDVS